MKRFGLATAHLFMPPRPGTTPGSDEARTAHNYTNPDDMVRAYLGRNHFSGDGNCGKFM